MEINPAVKHTFRDRGHGDGATTTKAIPERDLPVLFLPRKNSKPILNINLYFRCLKISKLTLLYKITETQEKKKQSTNCTFTHPPPSANPGARRRRLSPKRVTFSNEHISAALELVVTGKPAAGSPRGSQRCTGLSGRRGAGPRRDGCSKLGMKTFPPPPPTPGPARQKGTLKVSPCLGQPAGEARRRRQLHRSPKYTRDLF